jgi:hypothetical protein
MLDVSDAGARLQLDGIDALPDEFILVLSRDGRLNRKCRIMWRRDGMVGVRFLTRRSIAPKAKQDLPVTA